MKETLYCSKPSFPTLSKINNWGFWFKIMEKKDMCSSPPVESSKIATSSWTTTDRSTLEPTKKGYPHPKTKKKPQQDSRRGAVKIKSNPIPAGWVTHKLENNNTKEVLTLLWMFWIPHQGSWLGDQIKGLGIPRESGLEGQRDLTVGLPEDWGKQRLQSWRVQTKFCMHQDPEERSRGLTGDWTKTTCYCWRSSCGSMGWQELTIGTGALEGLSWHKLSCSLPLTLP